ncbi:cupin domain-containing protein [candidate division KSB1 bacterium]
MENKLINLQKLFPEIKKYFSPVIIGEVNDVYVKLAKIKGQKVPWHIHDNEDELFYIIKGSLIMEIENEPGFPINEGSMYIVKKGINHRVYSTEECLIMLIENKSTKHTGDIKAEITKPIEEQLKGIKESQ